MESRTALRRLLPWSQGETVDEQMWEHWRYMQIDLAFWKENMWE